MIITTNKVMRARDKHDFYPTPVNYCHAALAATVAMLTPARILDPGAGDGPWGLAARALWPALAPEITGIELRDVPRPAAYDTWVIGNFLAMPALAGTFDLVIGNPPYRHAEDFTRRALDLVQPGGSVVFLLRLAFLESKKRGSGLWREHPPYRVDVCSERPSFTGDGKTDATAYAVFHWIKGYQGRPALGWFGTTPRSPDYGQTELWQ